MSDFGRQPANEDDLKASPFGAHAPRRLIDVDDGTWGGQGADIIGDKADGAGPPGVKALSPRERGPLAQVWTKPPTSLDPLGARRAPAQERGGQGADAVVGKATGADPLQDRALPPAERARLADPWRKPRESPRLRPAMHALARHHTSGRWARAAMGCAVVVVGAIVVAVAMTLLVYPS